MNKTKAETYIYEKDVLVADVDRVAAMYGTDPTAAHIVEDDILDRFIRDVAYERQGTSLGDRAMILIELLDRERTRRFG